MPALTRTVSAAALTIAAMAAGTGALAQISSPTSSTGGYAWHTPGSSYIGFNVGQSDYSLSSGVGFPADKHDTVYNVYGGSYFSSNLGLELGYTNFGKITRAGGNTKAEGFNLSLVGKWPLSPQFNLLGKLGGTYGRTDVSSNPASGIPSGSETGFGVSYGLGAEYTFSPQLSAVLQYDQHDLKFVNTGRDRIGATTVGLRYRF